MYPVNPRDDQEIKEYIAHSWYTYEGGNDKGLHPWAGETKIAYTGPKPPFDTLEGHEKYSFLKTPRWKENPMEVGPLARLLVSYAAGRADVKETVNATLGKLNVPVDALFSTLGRTAARGIDCALAMIWLKEFYDDLIARVKTRETSTFNGEKWEPKLVAVGSGRRRSGGSSARSAGPLDQDQERRDRQLPARGADHLERFAARCQIAALCL